MKRIRTVQQLSIEICSRCKNQEVSLNISQCSSIAKNMKTLYIKGGKNSVCENIRDYIPGFSKKNGLSMHEKNIAEKVVINIFKNHWCPFSSIRRCMKEITK